MRQLAIFDVDGTLLRPPSMERRFLRFLWQYGERSTRELLWHFTAAGLSCCAGTAPQSAPRYYMSGMKLEKVARLAEDFVELEAVRAIYSAGLERIAQHRKAGCEIWLVSGAPAFLLNPLADRLRADFAIGLEVESAGGVFRERIAGIHPRGTGKLQLMKNATSRDELKLMDTFAYGDSIHDRYLLEFVEHPVAVNPDRKLRSLALRRGWRIEEFSERGKE